MRAFAPSIEALHAAAVAKSNKDFLRLRESGLADLVIGESSSNVRIRYGEPNRTVRAKGGEWWEYDEILRLASDQETGPDGKPPKDITGTLRLYFAAAPAGLESALIKAMPLLTQIQAWAPGDQETRSMVRLLDPVSRIERKYGPAPQKLKVGWTGGEVWIYPAANVAFVVSPLQAVEEPEGMPAGPKTRLVAGTIVGL
jgi:hypothetical protein